MSLARAWRSIQGIPLTAVSYTHLQIAALDVVLAINGDRLEIGDGRDAGEEGVHEDVQAGIVDGGQNLIDVEDPALPSAQVGGANVPAQRLEMVGEQRAPPDVCLLYTSRCV